MTNIKNFILICPDCHSILENEMLRCNNCSWKGLFDGGIYYLLPTKLEREKINEDLIHEKVHAPVWRDLLYKKKFYMEKFEKYWMKEIIKPETKNFIELAGGLCYISSLVKYYRPDITVWATDISPNYIKKKSKKVSDIMEVNIDFYAAVDAEKLPFLDNQFDAIFISHSIHHLCNIDKMLRESYRILRPGGIFLGIDIAAPRIKMLHEKDKKYRLKRALEFGINEKSISWQEWSEILKNSAIPEYTLTFEPGPKTKFQFFRKTQNLTRKIPIWIKFHK